MASLCDESRLITQFMPSLLHLASVQVGIRLLKDFDSGTSMNAYRSIEEKKIIKLDDIHLDTFTNYLKALVKCRKKLKELLKFIEEQECTRTFFKSKRELEDRKSALENRESLIIRNMNEYYKANAVIKQYRAQQRLMLIPPCLRPRVLEAVVELDRGVMRWKSDHSNILEVGDGVCIFNWKSNGMVDGTKAAKQLVRNTNIDIQKRFCLACTYCFEKKINTLWAEMNISGKTENFKTDDNSMVEFWVGRLHQRSQIPWKQDFRYFFSTPQRMTLKRYSCVFPFLKSRHRRRLFLSLHFAKPDDFWLCLHALTKEEEREICELLLYPLLRSYLQWPMRKVLLEAIEKIWHYIDGMAYHFLLSKLFFIQKNGEFDISNVFKDFWEMSPDKLKETVEENSNFRDKINSWLNEISRKRKAYFDELRNYNKQN